MKSYIQSVSKTTLLLLLVLLPLGRAFSQEASSTSFSLDQAIEYAIKNQVNVKNAQVETEIARARTNELIAVGLPQVDGSADMNKFLEIPTQFVPGEFFDGEPGTYFPVQFGQEYSASAGVSASQLLFDGTYFVGLKASKTYVELARKGVTQTKIETAVNVSKAYNYVLVSQERYKQLTNDLERLKKLRDDTKAMYDNGFVEKIDYDRIELNYNLVESALAQTERFVSNSFNILKFQMGMDVKTKIELTESLTDIQIDPTILTNDSVDYASRIEYSILQTQYKLADYDLTRYKTSRWPSLIAFGNYSANASRNELDFFDTEQKWYPTSVVGLKLTMPILGGYKIGFQVKQAELRQKKIENSFFTVEQSIRLEHQNAKNILNSNIAKLETQDKNRTLAREIARVSKIKYDQGVGSNLEVIDAENSLREAETNYYLALLETILSKIDLDKALGAYKY